MSHRFHFAVLVSLLALLATLTAQSANAQRVPYTPKAGSAERKLLMDTLRAPLENKLHKPVIFQVTALRVQNGWAFVTAIPLQPNGKNFNYSGTPYAAAARETEAFSGMLGALLRKTGSRWHIVTYKLGASDVFWYDWDKRYGAPHAILGVQ
jgi:hypothetical protein